MTLAATTVTTTPFEGQKPGTSGLRKKVKIFTQENYTENFVQCILDANGKAIEGSTLVVGGDGRFYCRTACEIIVRICAANGVSRLIVGQNGILSTPAVSSLIRSNKALGGIVLTASHNPGGPDNDFGIKFNCENGGPAPDNVTNAIYQLSTAISNYKIVEGLQIDLSQITKNSYDISGKPFVVDVVDSVTNYVSLMKEIFDFDKLKSLVTGVSSGKPLKMRVDAMNGVTGAYVREIFINCLGATPESVVHTTPLEDFGGLHPDPNLTYAKDLVDTAIPYFRRNGISGLARSMPTASAVDLVAKKLGKEVFEVPTGWKYFGNLMDANRLCLCGEESFGTGSNHIREKDGIWALLAWLSIMEHTGKGVEDILKAHWAIYGRNYFTRYDYEECDAAKCNAMMDQMEKLITDPKFIGQKFESGGKCYEVKLADNFSYKDPIDNSLATKQGLRVVFADGSRIVMRLSGTGSSGATVRLYIDSYERDNVLGLASDMLKPLIQIALQISQLPQFTGRDAPTVIT
uniref:phosphoglucomutase (alpha-D-glucose-1,6-bisphosphate-dependent) n=1 Tax=Phlebotomus papatasi TaxID=29031 RepID=A0A1B0DNJ0_PHLPP